MKEIKCVQECSQVDRMNMCNADNYPKDVYSCDTFIEMWRL